MCRAGEYARKQDDREPSQKDVAARQDKCLRGLEALESDLRLLLGCYMSLSGDVNINIDILDSGEYQINICAKADNINSPNII